MNKWLALSVVAFVGGFGAYTASRLSDGALAVVAGVVIGLVASTVVGLLLIYAMRGRPKPAEPEPTQQQAMGMPGYPYGQMMPPVVMMMPPAYPPQLAQPQQPPAPGVRLDAAARVPYVVSHDDDDA